MKRLLIGFVLALFCAGSFYSGVYAASDVTDRSFEVFMKVYPMYVELARSKEIMPSQQKLNSWASGEDTEGFDLESLRPEEKKAEEFRGDLADMLEPYGMNIEDFSALAAKISMIYTNLTVQEAMKEMDDADVDALSAYTQQFDDALASAGIKYTDEEISLVKKNLDKLNEIFSKTLMGGM